MTDSRTPTHTAFALRREGKKHGRWLEVGTARQESSGVMHLFLDRMPIGGFSGYVHLSPKGTTPPAPEPVRPEQPFPDGEEDAG